MPSSLLKRRRLLGVISKYYPFPYLRHVFVLMVVTVLVERPVRNGLQAGFRFPLLRGLHGVVLIVLRWMVRGVEVEEIEREVL
jgi:hypothetical protein